MTDRPRMQSTPFTPATSLTQPVALRLFYIEWRLLGEGPRSEHRDQMQLNDLAIAVQCAISDRRDALRPAWCRGPLRCTASDGRRHPGPERSKSGSAHPRASERP